MSEILKACEPKERLWFEFFLMTGMREQEVMHVYWSDVSFAKCTVKVTHKPDYNWTPKAYKERAIPVPESLIAILKAAKPKPGDCPLDLPDFRLQAEDGFSRLLQNYREACRIQCGPVLAPQVSCRRSRHGRFGSGLMSERCNRIWGTLIIESRCDICRPAGHNQVREKMNSVFEGVSLVSRNDRENVTLPSPKKMLGIASRFAAFDHALNIEEVADVLGLSNRRYTRRDGARRGRGLGNHGNLRQRRNAGLREVEAAAGLAQWRAVAPVLG